MTKTEPIKLVIWDLDNTLWSGTVYYQDKEAVTLKPGAAAALKELHKQGVINTICSKNNPGDVEPTLAKFDIAKYFEFSKIGWGRKSESIREISEHFKVPVGQILFVDDDPFERAEVQSSTADLRVIELSDPIDVLTIPGIMPVDQTGTDTDRVTLLKQQRDREQAQEIHQGDYAEFLASCQISMTVRLFKESDWPRVVQLFNRTNELNTTGNRYVLDKLTKEYQEKKFKIFVVELKDKFGDYGLIAESIVDVKGSDWSVRDLTVSCRTMGRGIGGALITAILQYAKEANIENVNGYLIANESNWRLKSLFEGRNFNIVKQEDQRTTYRFTFNECQIPDYKPWLKVNRIQSK